MPKIRAAGLKEAIFRHKGAKLLALFLSVVVWYSARGVTGVTRVLPEVPVEIHTKEEGVAVMSQTRSHVAVTFKGTYEEMATLESLGAKSRIKAVVYATVAIVVLIATRGRLGHKPTSKAPAASHELATAETC